jgi:hypothetical protein
MNAAQSGVVKSGVMTSDPELSPTSWVHNVQDLEKTGEYAHLTNTSVKNFTWENTTVTVKDRSTGGPRAILNNCSGIVKAGMAARVSTFLY